jgi:outer membrane protein OmpA-like peptidoglycan-associated protein
VRWLIYAAFAMVLAWTGVLAAAVLFASQAQDAPVYPAAGPPTAPISLARVREETTLPAAAPEIPVPEAALIAPASEAVALPVPVVPAVPAARPETAAAPAADPRPTLLPAPRAEPRAPAPEPDPAPDEPQPELAVQPTSPRPAETAPRREEVRQVSLRSRINDRDAFSPRAHAGEALSAIREGEVAEIWIEAHTDGSGERETERAISQAWADAMRDLLITEGVSPSKIVRAAGYGSDRPMEIVEEGAASAVSQRIEIRVVYARPVIRTVVYSD